MRISDWSSDVCSSDLLDEGTGALGDLGVGDDGGDQLDQLEHRDRVEEVDADHALRARGDHAQLHDRRSEERRVGKECAVRVELGGRRIIKKKKQAMKLK